MLPEHYKRLEAREDKDFPSASVFHYMWTAVEDYIVEHWCSFLQQWKPNICPYILMAGVSTPTFTQTYKRC